MAHPLAVGCDTCGVSPHEDCITYRGNRPTRPHLPRRRLAVAASKRTAAATEPRAVRFSFPSA